MSKTNDHEPDVKPDVVEKFRLFLNDDYGKELYKAAEEEEALVIDFNRLDKRFNDLSQMLLEKPEDFMNATKVAVDGIDLPGPVRIRFFRIPDTSTVNVRDLRSRHIGKFICVEGTVRRASEIRPEIIAMDWKCHECDHIVRHPVSGTFVSKPFRCGNVVDGKSCDSKAFAEHNKVMIDARWVTIEEPFELTEGEKPSQVNIWLSEDLVSPDGRRMTDPGNRLKILGVLKDVPKGKIGNVKLDFFMDANHVEPTETTWARLKISKDEEEQIKELARDPNIYDKLVDSMAPSLYGLHHIKESIILQLFGGVARELPDGTHFRGDIHILMIGDPSSGKCVTGDTNVVLDSGEMRPIESLVERKLQDNTHDIDDGVFAHGNDDILSMSLDGRVQNTKANIFWKRKSPEYLYEIETYSGKSIKVSPTHPFFISSGGFVSSKKASDLKENDFIASPRKIPVKGKVQKIGIKVKRSIANNARHIKVPEKTSPELCRFVAYVLAEGYVQKRKDSNLIWFSNNSQQLLKDFAGCAGIFGIPIHRRKYRRNSNSYTDLYLSSVELVDFLEKLDPSILKKSAGKKIPDIIMRSSNSEVGSFLRAFFDCEAHSGEKGIELSSASRELLEQVQIMLLRFGVKSSIHGTRKRATNSPEPKYRTYHRLLISGADVGCFGEMIGFGVPEKAGTLIRKISEKKSVYDVVPNLSPVLKDLRKRLRLTQDEMGVPRTTYMHIERNERNPLGTSLSGIINAMEKRMKKVATLKRSLSGAGIEGLKDARLELHLSQDSVAKSAGMSQSMLWLYENGKTKSLSKLPEIKRCMEDTCDSILSDYHVSFYIATLKKTYGSDIYWDRIRCIKKMPSDQEWVYDLQVPGVHNFIANQMFVHNSQLLKLVPEIVPRGRYVSGKGVTGAGLTATVTKDEQFMGGWVLEAGALVLTNKGLLAIDEFEKMNPDDQIAMHEALEQGSISIAKASIVATLPAKTSVLAGGNPKFSRFDPMRSISEQIDIPPTLLSRFDLKFTLRDVPDGKIDRKIVEHVLKSRHEADLIKPAISPDLVRKYVAYAKERYSPQLTPEVSKLLKNFYVKTRSRAEGGGPVPITLRQFEALMRLSEASAKIRLSNEITKDDANRAIRLMKDSLRDLGYDTETGEIDIDKSEGGTSFSERSKITTILNLIDQLSGDSRDIVPLGKLREMASKEGIETSEVDDIVERLKRDGVLFEPNPGYIQRP